MIMFRFNPSLVCTSHATIRQTRSSPLRPRYRSPLSTVQGLNKDHPISIPQNATLSTRKHRTAILPGLMRAQCALIAPSGWPTFVSGCAELGWHRAEVCTAVSFRHTLPILGIRGIVDVDVGVDAGVLASRTATSGVFLIC